ncbi:MAG: DNA polymerase III subunit chi [Rhodocyclaceae bacterium]
MTRIEFLHDAPDKLAAASRLIGEFYRQGRRVVVHAPDPQLAQRLDRTLWTQPAIGFVPHCSADSPLAAETPVVIAARLPDGIHDGVLINLDGELPPGFARFERLIEIVGSDEADRVPARERYRFYRDRGYPLASRSLAGEAR